MTVPPVRAKTGFDTPGFVKAAQYLNPDGTPFLPGGIVDWSEVQNKPAAFPPTAHGHAWGDLTGVPSTFTPSAHTHPWSDLTGVSAASPTFAGLTTPGTIDASVVQGTGLSAFWLSSVALQLGLSSGFTVGWTDGGPAATQTVKLARPSTGLFDIRADNGVRVRNLANSAFANFQAGRIQASGGSGTAATADLTIANSSSTNPIIAWTRVLSDTGLRFYSINGGSSNEIARFQDNGACYFASIGTLGGLNIGNYYLQRGAGDAGVNLPGSNVFEIASGTNLTTKHITSTSSLTTLAGSIVLSPSSAINPGTNGQLVVEATSNTQLTFKLKGSDGTVRSGSLTLS